MNSVQINRKIQARLEKELRSLSGKLALGEGLSVVWMPTPLKAICGEVKGKIIYVYEPNEDDAVKVLRHEVIDFCVTTRIVQPLVDLVNLLIKSKESEIYKEKERIVDAISELIC